MGGVGLVGVGRVNVGVGVVGVWCDRVGWGGWCWVGLMLVWGVVKVG